MTTVALVFVAADRRAARHLGAILARAGRSVLFTRDNERGPVVEHATVADYVLVIWSAASRTSPFIYERAREALACNRLVQIVVNEVEREQLAPVFGRHPAFALTDRSKILQAIPNQQSDQVLFAVKSPPPLRDEPSPEVHGDWRGAARMRVEMRDGAFPASPASAQVETTVDAAGETPELYIEHAPEERVERRPGVPSAGAFNQPSQAALEKQAGQLVHKIPSRMKVGVTENVEVRLGRALQQIGHGLVGSGALTSEGLPVVETMTVTLDGSPDAFTIVRRTRSTQLVIGSLIWKGEFDEQRFGRWLWYVRPKCTGTHELLLKVSADLSDSRGIPTSEALRDRVFPIRIKVDYATASARAVKWAATGVVGAAVTALIGAYTKEVWWPQIRLLLAGFGLAD